MRILQARILEWVAYPFSRGSSQPRNQTRVSCIAGGFFNNWATREAQMIWKGLMLDWYASSLSASLIRSTGTVLLSMNRASLHHHVLKWLSSGRVVLFVLFRWFYILEQFKVHSKMKRFFHIIPLARIASPITNNRYKSGIFDKPALMHHNGPKSMTSLLLRQ